MSAAACNSTALHYSQRSCLLPTHAPRTTSPSCPVSCPRPLPPLPAPSILQASPKSHVAPHASSVRCHSRGVAADIGHAKGWSMYSSCGCSSSSSRSSRGRQGVRTAAAGAGGPGGMAGDVEELNRGKSFQEQLSGETNTQVTDVMDIDRTPELLAWVFGSLFGRKEKEQDAGSGEAAAAAPQDAAMREAQDQGPAAAAAAGTAAAAAAPASTAAGPSPAEAPGQRTEVATIGGGCFWCIEACFQDLRGVVSVTSGYAGGHVENPTYQQVLTKKTGHAEVVQVEYDPAVLSYKDVLQIFMSVHDPTTPNRQGNDVGPQYRSIVLYGNEEQKRVAEEVIAEANKGLWFGRKVVTELVPLQAFYRAEAYHQLYYAKNPGAGYCMVVVRPKLQEFRRKYAKLLKTNSV